jgi:hypothetical protein
MSLPHVYPSSSRCCSTNVVRIRQPEDSLLPKSTTVTADHGSQVGMTCGAGMLPFKKRSRDLVRVFCTSNTTCAIRSSSPRTRSKALIQVPPNADDSVLYRRLNTSKMAERLPPELWSHIFDLAADEDVIFYPGLQTSMAQSTWSKSPWSSWTVRTPQDTINIIQRRSYATKKVRISGPCQFAFVLRYLTNHPSLSSLRAKRGGGSDQSFSSDVFSSTTPPSCATSAAS